MELALISVFIILSNGVLAHGLTVRAPETSEKITVSLEALQDNNDSSTSDSNTITRVDNNDPFADISFSSGLSRILTKYLAKKVLEDEALLIGKVIVNNLSSKISKKLNQVEVDITSEISKMKDIMPSVASDNQSEDDTQSLSREYPNGKIIRERKSAIEHIFQNLRPEVTLKIQSPKSKETNHNINVPLEVDMTILQLFMVATRTYIDNRGTKENIPFNVRLDWSRRLGCFTIVEALGIQSRKRTAWFIIVSDRTGETVYNSRCLPEEDFFLRPGSTVDVSLKRVKKQTKSRSLH